MVFRLKNNYSQTCVKEPYKQDMFLDFQTGNTMCTETLTRKVPKKQTTKLRLQILKNFQYKLYYVEKSKTRWQIL